MDLTILGKYGPFSVNEQSTSGYLIQEGNECALLDLGAGTVSKMLCKIDINKLKFLFLSHTHFDHISDFGVLSYALAFLSKGKKLKVYMFDDNSKNAEIIKGIKEFEIINIKEGVNYSEGEFNFSFYKMTHPVISHGIKITANNKTLAYSGDTTVNDNIKNLISGADLFLADGAFLQEDYNENKPHMSVKQVCEIANESNIKTIVTHISYNYTDEKVIEEINKYSKITSIAVENNIIKV